MNLGVALYRHAPKYIIDARIRRSDVAEKMRYIDPRRHGAATFSEILLEGLAPDGGLATARSLSAVRAGASLRELRQPDLSRARLRDPVALHRRHSPTTGSATRDLTRTYTAARVRSRRDHAAERRSSPALHLLACRTARRWRSRTSRCSCSATCSSTSCANGRTLNILGATSGDTGSAAEYAMRGKRGIRVFMLSPHGRMSPFQQRRCSPCRTRTSTTSPIEACSTTARTSSRRSPRRRLQAATRIGAVNSINWARVVGAGRVLLQGLLRAATSSNASRSLSRCRRATSATSAPATSRACMGLPIRRLVLATNENDVLDEFFRTGVYRVRSTAEHARDLQPVDGHLQGVELRALRVRPGRPRCGAGEGPLASCG